MSAALSSGHIHTDNCHGDSCKDDRRIHPHHYEVRGISSLQVPVPPLTESVLDRLDEWIRTVLWENRLPEDSLKSATQPLLVLRCKGLFRTTSGTTRVLQGVRNLYEISAAGQNSAELGVDVGKLVFIGKGLDDRIRSSLLHLLNSED